MQGICIYLTNIINDLYFSRRRLTPSGKERVVKMKQLIVMISMIMVGIAIAGIVSGFGDKAVKLGEATQNKLVVEDMVKVPTGK